ncbi:hypothetical protein EN45_093450 [Penicillium chrysogenum]|uniref:Uncharacterized protein n=1 Tax=Penicillium chrysogenum TaxID=5076 RepID=A0A162C1K7_PENCH|nr:hypothetical protein EN45_093450 [Penicillium chrysogenum]
MLVVSLLPSNNTYYETNVQQQARPECPLRQVSADSNGKYLPVESPVTKKTHQIIRNVSGILGASGTSLDQVTKANVYFVQLDRNIYRNPARSSVEVNGLPKPADLETEVIALES